MMRDVGDACGNQERRAAAFMLLLLLLLWGLRLLETAGRWSSPGIRPRSPVDAFI